MQLLCGYEMGWCGLFEVMRLASPAHLWAWDWWAYCIWGRGTGECSSFVGMRWVSMACLRSWDWRVLLICRIEIDECGLFEGSGGGCWSLLYNSILRSWAYSLRLHVILHEWIAFYSVFLNIHQSGVLTMLTCLVPRETSAVMTHSVFTIQPHHFMQSHIHKVHVYLAVMCYCGNKGLTGLKAPTS